MNEAAIAAAFIAACDAELEALKPGNVHIHSGGHGMTAEDFRKSARASAPPIAAHAPVGERIRGAVRATFAAASQNTNLGIILLCAPLAHARQHRTRHEPLRKSLNRTLAALSADDAALVFEAIAFANPGGLGVHRIADVRSAPSTGLVDAMRLASAYDRIANAYATGFEDVFDFGLPYLIGAQLTFGNGPGALTALYLQFLSAFQDSHIARKFGSAVAETVRADAAAALDTFLQTRDTGTLLSFDARLKKAGINPGTSADLTVATLFAAALDVT